MISPGKQVAGVVLALLCGGLSAATGAAERMLDPAADDPAGAWCYLAKSTTVIGVPYQPDVTQVTYDGALFTHSAELCFFFGEPLRPLLARQKTFLDGWIPVVQYAWRDGAIDYAWEAFAAALDDGDTANTVNFIRLRMANRGARAAKGVVVAAMRHNGGDYRHGGSPFKPAWRYEMADDAVFRDNALIFTLAPAAARQAVPGEPYAAPFCGADKSVTSRAEVCLVRYQRELAAGQSATMDFKMPRVPLHRTDADTIAKLRAAPYDRFRQATVDSWRRVMDRGTTLEIPERQVQDSQRASLVQLMLATRLRNGQRFQTSGLPYPNFFMIDFVDMRMAYDALGQPEFARQSFPQLFARQLPDGLFCDTSLSGGQRLWSSHGHMVHSLAHHYLMTRDQQYARSIYPKFRAAVEWIGKARAADPHGLMPPAWPYDAEMIDGYYTSHNLWSLLGLRSAIRMARELGEASDAEAWSKVHDEYFASFSRALQAAAGDDRYVPTGLYAFLTGKKARRGFAEYQTNCDWENMLLAYPTEALDPGDRRVAATLRRLRGGFAEGIMTYRHGQHLHQYVTTNVLAQHLVRGESKQALIDLYHVLLHCGPTHEGFENLVCPWQDRMVSPGCPPPHAWAAAKIALTVRNCLVHEYGGRAGLDSAGRELYLFSAVSPAWAVPGQRLALRNAATEFGPLSAEMAFTETGATVTIRSRFHHPPARIVLRVPYFATLQSFRCDAQQSRQEDGRIVLSPDVRRVELAWQIDPRAHDGTTAALLKAYRGETAFAGVDAQGMPILRRGEAFLTAEEQRPAAEPLSFQVVRQAFLHEYARRCGQFTGAGGPLVRVEAPAMLTAAERRAAFRAAHGDPAECAAAPGIAAGCPATASSHLPQYPPAKAVDDDLSLASSWQADPYPQWWQVDLGRAVRVGRIHLFPYWGLNRHYQYTVEVSLDGKQWTTVVDLRNNRRLAQPAGDSHDIPPQPARYVRVNMLYHSLNKGVHLVEMRVYEAQR